MFQDKSVVFFSPAKINLFLKVLSKRSDSFHEIVTLMQAVSLGDFLYFQEASEDQLTADEDTFPLDASNLILRSLDLFRKKTHLERYFKVHVEKRIPMQAGLGGGSSNAATTLWVVNHLTKAGVSQKQLMSWSSELGSDVPFFFSQGTALCRGRGEDVENVDPIFQKHWMLVKPSFSLDTARVYQKLQEKDYMSSKTSSKRALTSFKRGEFAYFNDLEKPAFFMESRLCSLRKKLLKQGVSQLGMSGSGTTLFFPKPSGKKLAMLSDKTIRFFSVSTLNRKGNNWYQNIA